MNKKMNRIVLLSALMVVFISAIGTVSAESFNLTADGGDGTTAFKVGEVEVTNDEDYIYVTYSITHEDEWCITETHLDIAASVGEIHQTKKGNPKPGKFDYSGDHDCVDKVEYKVPMPDNLNEDGNIVIAAHAVVQLYEGNSETDEEIFTYESAWGEGDEFNEGRNWAMYMTYTIALPVIPEPIE